MDTHSETALSKVCPELADKIRAASDALNAEGTFILVVSGMRTAEEQNALYAQGRTTTGKIVTNAKAGQSMHNYGLAADIVPYTTGNSGQINWNAATPQFQHMVAAMKAQGLAWGGDWRGALGDFDHFQLTDLPASPSLAMRRDYGAGPTDLSAIWNKAIAREYEV